MSQGEDLFPYFAPRRDPRFHGLRCDQCTAFVGCNKTPRPDQNYCAFYPSRFQRKDQPA